MYIGINGAMMRQAANIDWNNSEVALPAFLTMFMMPFTYSIADDRVSVVLFEIFWLREFFDHFFLESKMTNIF